MGREQPRTVKKVPAPRSMADEAEHRSGVNTPKQSTQGDLSFEPHRCCEVSEHANAKKPIGICGNKNTRFSWNGRVEIEKKALPGNFYSENNVSSWPLAFIILWRIHFAAVQNPCAFPHSQGAIPVSVRKYFYVGICWNCPAAEADGVGAQGGRLARN